MKTESRFSRLAAWSARCATGVLALAFCASAFATDPSKNVVVRPTEHFAYPVAKICYVRTIASGIPQPCERVYGTMYPTTANPLEVYGRAPEIK